MNLSELEINQQLGVEIVRLAEEAVSLSVAGQVMESDLSGLLLREAVDRLASCSLPSRIGMLHRLQRRCHLEKTTTNSSGVKKINQ